MDERWHHSTKEGIPTEPAKSPSVQPTSDLNSDPNEDDLDDLDDLLDEFSAAKHSVKQDDIPLLEADKFHNHDVDQTGLDATSTEFSKQLQEQMAALMGNVEESPEMRREIQAMIEEIASTGEGEDTHIPTKENSAKGSSNLGKSFQATIQETMERMQASEENVTAAATSEDPDEILTQMLKEMQAGSAEGAESEEDFSQMLMGMMEQLTNKDILMEPMKELHDRFPAWMAKNRSKVKEDDLKRYETQQRLVGEIVGRFNEKNYSDSNPHDREFIVERMQQMQAAGSPPADLVGDMNAAQEALGELNSGCAQQ